MIVTDKPQSCARPNEPNSAADHSYNPTTFVHLAGAKEWLAELTSSLSDPGATFPATIFNFQSCADAKAKGKGSHIHELVSGVRIGGCPRRAGHVCKKTSHTWYHASHRQTSHPECISTRGSRSPPSTHSRPSDWRVSVAFVETHS